MQELAGPPALMRVDASTRRPFPHEPSFEGLVAAALEPFPAIDAAFSDIATRTIEAVASLADPLAAEIDATAVGSSDPPGAGVPLELAEAVDRGDAADALRQSVLPYLPQVDAPIAVEQEDPPPAPTGGGGPYDRSAYAYARVRTWYQAALEREPDYPGAQGWVDRLIAREDEGAVYRDFLEAANVERAARGLPPYP